MSEEINKEINVGFSVGSTKRKIIEVKERDNGDLVIALNRACRYREANNIADTNSPLILHQKYSVHRSLKSTHDINTLTHIIELSDGRKIETSHYTQAIKKFKRFAPIFTAISPSLISERYSLDEEKGKTLILGEHDPESSILFYMICVCERGTPENFNFLGETHLFSSKKISFSHFDVHIFWTFTLRIVDADGAKIHFTTHRDRKEVAEQERYRWLVEGLQTNEICELFKESRNQLHVEYIHLTLMDANPREREIIQNIPFIYATEDIFKKLRKDLFGM